MTTYDKHLGEIIVALITINILLFSIYSIGSIYDVKFDIMRTQLVDCESKDYIIPNGLKISKDILYTHDNEFIKSIIKISREENKAFGIPASITIAQAILESKWGESKLTKEYNNYFGIKYYREHKMTNGYVEYSTREFKKGRYITKIARFAKYDTKWFSFRHHSIILSRMGKEVLNGTYLDWLLILKNNGYSTSPSYTNKLKRLIEEYKLYEFDVKH